VPFKGKKKRHGEVASWRGGTADRRKKTQGTLENPNFLKGNSAPHAAGQLGMKKIEKKSGSCGRELTAGKNRRRREERKRGASAGNDTGP